MDLRTELHRIELVDSTTNPVEGIVRWALGKSLWFLAHSVIAIVGGFATLSLETVTVFAVTTAVTLCLGHSLGMHRKLIHNSYQCPPWLEYLWVHLGTIVGLAGPLGMMKAHDVRDWAQRQPSCHPYLCHGSAPWKDAWWQLNCDLDLAHPPRFSAEPRVASDPVFMFMERTWMLQQLPLAALLFLGGGWAWVIWGVSARVSVSVVGHWLIGYLAHNQGEMDHHVSGAAVQGRNVRWTSYITMGECWHNNHHAFPGSARLGLYAHQADPGWAVLQVLAKWGWVWGIVLPADLPPRDNLQPLTLRAAGRASGESTVRGPV
jgi:fatty-acid desaturase